MSLLGSAGMLGLGTLLIGELPRRQNGKRSLVTTTLAVAGAAGGALGVLFALVAPYVSADLKPLAASFESITLFALGTSLTAFVLVLDQALIGLFRGELQLGRNALFALGKLGALVLASLWLPDRLWLTIYATWLIGNLVSIAGVAGFAATNGAAHPCRLEWRLLRGLGRVALGHHALNLALQAPSLALAMVVTATLSATTNAYFYIAWVVAGFICVGPTALATAVYAVGASAPAALAPRLRFTLQLALLVSLIAYGGLLISGDYVLGLFGASYAEQAGLSLRLLGLGVFPLIVRDHFITICRIHGQFGRATLLVVVGGLLGLALASGGARVDGLPGLCLGYVAALAIEAVVTAPMVYRSAMGQDGGRYPPVSVGTGSLAVAGAVVRRTDEPAAGAEGSA